MQGRGTRMNGSWSDNCSLVLEVAFFFFFVIFSCSHNGHPELEGSYRSMRYWEPSQKPPSAPHRLFQGEGREGLCWQSSACICLISQSCVTQPHKADRSQVLNFYGVCSRPRRELEMKFGFEYCLGHHLPLQTFDGSEHCRGHPLPLQTFDGSKHCCFLATQGLELRVLHTLSKHPD